MSSSSPAPKTWCRCSRRTRQLANRGNVPTRTATASDRTVPRSALPPAHRRPVRAHRALDASRAIDRCLSGARSPGTTSPPATARPPKAASPILQMPSRIFSWLICESYDDKGNVIVYEYSRGERRRRRSRAGQRAQPRAHGQPLSEAHPVRQSHAVSRRSRGSDRRRLADATGCSKSSSTTARALRADAADARTQLVRARTRQDHSLAGAPGSVLALSRRVRGAHLPPLPARADVPSLSRRARQSRDCLVRSTEFTLSRESSDRDSFITLQLTQSGYVRRTTNAQRGYLKKSLPPLEFEYSQADHQRQTSAKSIRTVWRTCRPGSTAAATSGSTWTAKGCPASSPSRRGGWFYKRNLEPADGHVHGREPRVDRAFDPVRSRIAAGLRGRPARQQFLDLAGDGQLDLRGPSTARSPGFYERTLDAGLGAVHALRVAAQRSTGTIPTCASSISPATATPTS